MLGVPKGKLTSWSNLKLRAIDPAVTEVNGLSDYVVEVAPVKTGRRVTHVELRWWRKDAGATAGAERELTYSKVGRKSRMAETTETIVPPRPATMAGHDPLRTETYETARMRHPGFDIYWVENEWRGWAAGRAAPQNPDAAFLAFFRTYAKNNPL